MGSCTQKEVAKDIPDLDCACQRASAAAVTAIKASMPNCECRHPAVPESSESNPEIEEEAKIQSMVAKAIAIALQSKYRPQTPSLSGRPRSIPEVVAPEVVAPEVVAPEVVAPEVVAPEVV
jgi:hypothetical protein